jgi:pimeloyl-ACP methyl ester carboxylesterase
MRKIVIGMAGLLLCLAAAFSWAETPVTLGNGIAGTLNLPAGVKHPPVVLMLHGFGSYKDEVGNMYKRLAAALEAKGVASLRIDFSGFGKSDGDTGATTISGQVKDAEAAYAWLVGSKAVDTARIGVIGFSLGGGIATVITAQHPDWFKSRVTWSSVGDFTKDFKEELGEEAFATAYSKGVVGLDLGWRTIVLKKDFFESLKAYDLGALNRGYTGAYLAIAGSKDFSSAYAPGFVDAAAAKPKEAWIVPGADHIYGVFGDDQSMANGVINKTAEWFSRTL